MVQKVRKIEHFLQDCSNYVSGAWAQGSIDEPVLLSVSIEYCASVNNIYQIGRFSVIQALYEIEVRVLDALRDDFNTPKAVNAIFELIAVASKMLHEAKVCKLK